MKAEADIDQFMLEGHKFPRFAKVKNVSLEIVAYDFTACTKNWIIIIIMFFISYNKLNYYFDFSGSGEVC